MSPKRSDIFKAGRREEILAAAIGLFVTQGYDRTTIREIARAAGVSTGAIYVYYPTKGSMLQAMCSEQAQQMRVMVEQTLNDLPADADPLAASLLAFIGRFGAFNLEDRRKHERLDLLLRYEATRDEAVAASVREVIESWRALVITILRAQQAAGRIRADIDVVSLAELFMALPGGLEMTELLAGTATDWPVVVGTVADVLWRGLAPPAPHRNGHSVLDGA